MRMTFLCVLSAGLVTLVSALQTGDRIRGKVVTNSGLPVANAKISIKGGTNSAYSHLDGSYVLNGLTPGTYTLIAESKRFWPAVENDVAAGQSADFRLIERKYLTGAGGYVFGNLSMAQAKGVLDAAKLAGDTQAEYVAVNSLLREQPNNLDLKKRSSDLEKLLNQNPAHIVGTIVDASGSPVPRAEVKGKNEITGKVFTTETNDKGEYQLSVYPLGKYEIGAVRGNDSATTKINADILPNIKLTHDVQLASRNK